MEEQGWIRLHRQIQDSELWLNETFTWAQAWIDLLLMANYKDSMFLLRGNIVKVKRGEIARAEGTLGKRWRWSRNKVRRFLKWLKTEQQIEQQQSSVINIIRIVNYERYQQNDTTERQQKDNRKTTEGTRLKNVKKEKNEKKNIYGEFKNVLLTKDQHVKLKAECNDIDGLLDYFSSEKKMKAYKYAEDYLAIKKWGIRAFNEARPINQYDFLEKNNDK